MCQQNRSHREAHISISPPEGRRPASIELLSAQSLASSHGRKCSLQKRRSSTYRLSCVRELISITRAHTRSTGDHRPILGDYAWSCGSWSLYSATGNIPMALSEAIIATYMTIHMARSPGSHRERIASPCQSSGRERKSCGCGFQATKARVRFARRAYPPCQRHRDAGVALARARHRHNILRHIVR